MDHVQDIYKKSMEEKSDSPTKPISSAFTVIYKDIIHAIENDLITMPCSEHLIQLAIFNLELYLDKIKADRRC